MTTPPLQLLVKRGWRLLTAAGMAAQRTGPREVILSGRLIEVLQRHRFDHRGTSQALSPAGIEQVVRAVQALHMADGLIGASERLYRMLTLGVTVTEFMPDGRKHQVTVPLVDWQRPEANQFDLAVDPPMLSAQGGELHAPGTVGYVNGLPLVLIETGPDDPRHGLADAIARHLRHQQADGLPHLYAHAHLLLAVGGGQARYGTTGTPAHLWARWREEEPVDDGVAPLPRDVAARLMVSLLTPARLMGFLHHFVLFDRRRGKVVARYPQFFGVRAMLARIQQRRPDGAREGGVVWHTTGSGKSLTMVFLTKALVQHPATRACRVLVVTDRTDLEDQLARNFIDTGAFGSAAATRREGEQARAGSGRDLARRIGQGTERIVFTLLHKFTTASRLPDCYNPSADLVVLVDEGHRSHGGELHRLMRRTMPRAAYLAFTGTPLLKHEKTTHRFGPIVHAHTWLRAVQDGTVAPLLYEERIPTRGGADGDGDAQRMALIARDIATHFHQHIKTPGLGLKGQVATASKLDAIRCQRHLDETGLVSSAVVMSPPDSREGETAVDALALSEVRQWWNAHAGRHPEAYEAQVLRDFGSDGGPDLLIVVDRLLTGFDEPRNAVLYIDKPLRAHSLIQAVARVNRLHAAKRHGLLVDYRGTLKALDTAAHAYHDLESRTQGGFDLADIEGLYKPWHAEYQRLPGLHRALRAVFDGVPDMSDPQACRQWLSTRLPDFDDALSAFSACLQTALASRSFLQDPHFGATTVQTYQADLQFFNALRRQVRRHDPASDMNTPYRRGPRPAGGLSVREPEAAYRPTPSTTAQAGPERRVCAEVLMEVMPLDQALALDDAVQTARAEHSLHPQNAEAAIRQALLPALYMRVGLERARALIDRVVGSAQDHAAGRAI